MYDDRYKGCPDCGEMEDKDCRCTAVARSLPI